jgi:hypothetical protein
LKSHLIFMRGALLSLSPEKEVSKVAILIAYLSDFGVDPTFFTTSSKLII